jgi:hypothetical protein
LVDFDAIIDSHGADLDYSRPVALKFDADVIDLDEVKPEVSNAFRLKHWEYPVPFHSVDLTTQRS